MSNRILFVDDERSFLEGLRRLLRSHEEEWDIHVAFDGSEALEQICSVSFDVVVSDVDMPRMDGFALLTFLRDSEQTRDIPVIMLTGAGQLELKRRALELGATDLLSKPVHIEDLVARIRSALRLKAHQDELKELNRSLEDKVKQRTMALEYSRQDIILRLAKAAEYRDTDTGNHVMRVACYCRVLAEEMGMPAEFVQNVFLAAPLHDIGKIGIADGILMKPAELTVKERRIMQRHCVIGTAIMEQYPTGMQPFTLWNSMSAALPPEATDNPLLAMASSIALTHHEHWDGHGYPGHVKGEAIPIEGRIAALADVYDALSFERPYKPAFSEEKTLAIIQEEAGSHFDPAVYLALLKTLDKFRAIKSMAAEETRALLAS